MVTQFLFVHKGVCAIVIGNLVSKLDAAGIETGGIWRRETCAENDWRSRQEVGAKSPIDTKNSESL